MLSFDKFKEHAVRVLSIQSSAESGNEEVARYFQSLMHDYGFKTVLQPVRHSIETLSKRQCNLIGFVGDNLVDRTSRRGILFSNPLDVTTGNLPQLWTITQGNPHAPVVMEDKIVGAGAVQGKLDFLCKIFAAFDLLDKRHKQPLYLVGTCGSHSGMLGSKFLIESLAVNPKEVYTFAPTQLKVSHQAAGQVLFTVDLDSANRDRDSRGYNRSVDITAFGYGVDFANRDKAVNAFEILMDLILEAAEKGFDFQWSGLETFAASGTHPDLARAQIFLTAFQFEDFKQFLKNKVQMDDSHRAFRIEYGGISEGGTHFIPSDLVEVVLELDYEWKEFMKELNSLHGANFVIPETVGALNRIRTKSVGKLAISFELRFLPEINAIQMEENWRERVKRVSAKYARFHFNVQKDYLVQGVASSKEGEALSTNYLSDAGWFDRSKFPVSIVGSGNMQNLPKGPNEAISWSDLEAAVHYYQALMLKLSQSS